MLPFRTECFHLLRSTCVVHTEWREITTACLPMQPNIYQGKDISNLFIISIFINKIHIKLSKILCSCGKWLASSTLSGHLRWLYQYWKNFWISNPFRPSSPCHMGPSFMFKQIKTIHQYQDPASWTNQSGHRTFDLWCWFNSSVSKQMKKYTLRSFGLATTVHEYELIF